MTDLRDRAYAALAILGVWLLGAVVIGICVLGGAALDHARRPRMEASAPDAGPQADPTYAGSDVDAGADAARADAPRGPTEPGNYICNVGEDGGMACTSVERFMTRLDSDRDYYADPSGPNDTPYFTGRHWEGEL